MNGPKLGKLIEEGQETGRDAIHVAVVGVRAAEELMPGDHVGKVMTATGLTVAGFGHTATTIGVVDPFLKEPVQEGDWFWLCLYPGSVTSLRHEWTHPDFAPETVKIKLPGSFPSPGKLESVAWLQQYAEEVGVSYVELMGAGQQALATGSHYVLGNETPGVVWEKHEEFWQHYGIVTGKTVPEAKKSHVVFACAC